MPGLVIRILIGLATILATLGVLAWLERDSYSQVNICVVDETEREKIREIMIGAVEEGLSEQVQHLFTVWMKDASEQPKRAIVGTNAAINAFVRARANILKWDPTICDHPTRGDTGGMKLQSGESRPYVLPPRRQ